MPGILIPPGDSRSVSLGGLGVVFKISGEEDGMQWVPELTAKYGLKFLGR